MKGFYKPQSDGSIHRSDAIHTPSYSLTEDNKSESRDGWVWFDDSQIAYAYFSNLASGVDKILADLDNAFESMVPESIRPSFETAWTTVRNLVQAGKSERAASYVSSLEVPEELVSAKNEIAIMINQL
jgi:hypothetical protein